MAIAMIANHGQLEIVAHIENHSATKVVNFIISFLLIVVHLLLVNVHTKYFEFVCI